LHSPWRRCRLQLQIATFLSDHPGVGSRALALQAENFAQFAAGRFPAVITLQLRLGTGKASVVFRQLLLSQILVRGFVVVDLLPSQLLNQTILM
jgi:hypothetical protein